MSIGLLPYNLIELILVIVILSKDVCETNENVLRYSEICKQEMERIVPKSFKICLIISHKRNLNGVKKTLI